MARKPLYTDVFQTDTFDEWRLKTNSIKINLLEMYDEVDALPTIAVLLAGDQTITGLKTNTQTTIWDKEYSKGEVTPMLQLKVRNSDNFNTNDGHIGSGPAIDFYNPDTSAPGNTWLTGRIASITETNTDWLPDSSLVFYTGVNVRQITEKLRITSKGMVGIGTSTPSTMLSVSNLTTDAVLSLRSKESNHAGVTFGDNKSDKSGSILYHNTGNSMRFHTGEASTSSSAERLRITSSGSVGIGTSSPSQKLDVVGAIKSSSFIEAGEATGGVALTLNDGYGNSNVTFNHNNGKATVSGSSGRIRCDVDENSANMEFQLKDNASANTVADLPVIVRLQSSKISLLENTDVNGVLTAGRIGIGEVAPDLDLCVGNKSTEPGNVSIDAYGGYINLRPTRDTTGGWLLNAHDASNGSFDLARRTWNLAANKYIDSAVLRAHTINKRLQTFGPLGVNCLIGSDADLLPDVKFAVKGTSNNDVSAQFGGTIQVNQLGVSSRAYAFLSTNAGSAMVGGNLRFNGTEYEKGTNYRGSAAIELIEGSSSTGQIVFLRANDTNDANYAVSESGRFDEDGQLGLGVPNPTQKLDVNGNIKSSSTIYSANDQSAQFVLSNANLKDKRFGIWREGTGDTIAIGPQNTTGLGNAAIRVYRDATVNLLKGGKIGALINHNDALVNKKYVDDLVSGNDPLSDLSNLNLNRVDTNSDGGRITFKRSVDNAGYWHIDTHGSTTNTRLRVLHYNGSGLPETEALTITSLGGERVGIRENDPDWDLCIGNKSTEAGNVSIDAGGGAISLRPTKNTTHAWMINASDSRGGGFAIESRKWNSAANKYDSSSVMSFYNDKRIVARGDLVVDKSLTTKAALIAGSTIIGANDIHLGSQEDRWILHSRQGSSSNGDFFELAPRNTANTNWDWGKGLRQLRSGSVGIGGSPTTGDKLYVDGNIKVEGSITQAGKVRPKSWGGGLTTFDIYSDGGTIGAGKAGTLPVWFNSDGNAYVKNKLSLGYSPTANTDAVSKQYVDTLVSTSVGGIINTASFSATGATSYWNGTKVVSTTASGNSIPNGKQNYSHGRTFAAKLTSTSATDGGGILISVTDDNDDEHAISVYNPNAKVGKEVFHVRSTTGDTFISGNLYAGSNIGLDGKLSFSRNSGAFFYAEESNNVFAIRRKSSGTSTSTALSINSTNKITLGTQGTDDNHLINKKYVDDRTAGVIAPGATNAYALNVTNVLPRIYLTDTTHLSGVIEQQEGIFKVLRADGKNSTTTETYSTSDSASGLNPLEINLNNGSHAFKIGSPNVTAGGHKVWHAGNDGSGSGLDADKLDGKNSSEFSLTSHNHDSVYVKQSGGAFTGDIAFTNQSEKGITWSKNSDFASIKFYNKSDGDNDCRLEFLIGDNYNEYFSFVHKPSGKPQFDLLKISNTELLYKGQKVLVKGDDGSGSGLDADTLDGNHASDFVKSSAVFKVPKFKIIDNANASSFSFTANTIIEFDIKTLAGLTDEQMKNVYAIDATAYNFGINVHNYYGQYYYPSDDVADQVWKTINGSHGSSSDDDCGSSASVFLPVAPNQTTPQSTRAKFRFNTRGSSSGYSKNGVQLNGVWYMG